MELNKETVKKFLNYTLWVLSFLLFFVLGNSVKAEVITDNFDSYTVGNLNGQGGWTYNGEVVGTAPSALVVSTTSYSAPNAITSQGGTRSNKKLFATSSNYVQISYKFYIPSGQTGTRRENLPQPCFGTGGTDCNAIGDSISLAFNASGTIGYSSSGTNITTTLGTIPLNTWVTITEEYQYATSTTWFRDIWINSTLATSTTFTKSSNSIFATRATSQGNNILRYYVDDLYTYTGSDVPPGPQDSNITRVWISQPIANSTTTTPVQFTLHYYLNSETHGGIIPEGFNLKIFTTQYVSGTGYTNIPINPDTVVYDVVYSTTTTLSLNDNKSYFASVDLYENEVPDYCNNPATQAVICGWLQATQQLIVSSQTTKFIVGALPTTIEEQLSVIFDSANLDTGIFEGQCAFIATTTCDMTSPTTWQGCMLNVGIRLFCPSTGAINFATSTLINSFENKIPFGFFTQTIGKISAITSGTGTAPTSDIVVTDMFGNSSTTIFSWSAAKDFMDNVIPLTAISIMIFVEWILFGLYAMMRVSQMHD